MPGFPVLRTQTHVTTLGCAVWHGVDTLVSLVVAYHAPTYFTACHLSQTMCHPQVKTKSHLQPIRRKKQTNKKNHPKLSSLTFLQRSHFWMCSSRWKAGSATGIQVKGHLKFCGKGRQMGWLTVKLPCYNNTQPFHWDSQPQISDAGEDEVQSAKGKLLSALEDIH